MYMRTLFVMYHMVPTGTMTVLQNKTKQTVTVNLRQMKPTVMVRCTTDQSRSWDLALLLLNLTFAHPSSTSE